MIQPMFHPLPTPIYTPSWGDTPASTSPIKRRACAKQNNDGRKNGQVSIFPSFPIFKISVSQITKEIS